ncbi:MAG: prepilin peptidase, partial [Myxococcaceae bacterium]|nr:prepilin peptidase [Myxococcaceae bacterium]
MASLQVGFLFVLGLLFGSFLNVVIHRLPLAESETSTWWVGYGSLLNPRRSHCPKCGHAIAWYENVPVLSWLALRGRCSGCRAPISPRYALVELLTGLLFVACSVRFGWTPALLSACALVVVVVPLVFIDAEHWILPFELTLPGIALGVALAVPLGLDAVGASALGAVAAFVGFRAMEFFGFFLFRKEALGAGDKFLLAVLGAFLGWRPLFGVVFLSSLQGALFGLVSLGLRGRASSDGPRPEAGGGA